MFKKINRFFDKLEDKIRAALSHRPILYAIIGGIAIVLFWRGVWMTADLFSFMTGPVSILISVLILLSTGLFVSFFIGDQILLSGLKKGKKLVEKTESEIETQEDILKEINEKLDRIGKEIREREQERSKLKGGRVGKSLEN